MLDYKTSKDAYAGVSLQLTAYARADHVIDADGVKHPMPQCEADAVLHVTAKQRALKPVEISNGVFGHFLALRETFGWERERSNVAIGKPTLTGGSSLITGTQAPGWMIGAWKVPVGRPSAGGPQRASAANPTIERRCCSGTARGRDGTSALLRSGTAG
ncbi:hypothetical protein ACH4U6_35695 [Streptomyces netropsis]|uniref:hypothetical protein n=1 Tax=Streptomyces netropsis TaxID=55404 RepID=UPI0037BB5AB9